jgi:hypothetical protein
MFMSSDDNNTVELFSGTLWEAQMITSLLQNEGIESFLKNSVLQPYAFNPSIAQQIKIMVLKSDLEKSEEIMNRYLNKI